MITFTLHCLGAFALSIGTTPITHFATDKTRALLAYLALEAGASGARPHARAELLGLLWPEIAQEAAQNSLRVTLHRLRETLERAQAGAGDALILSTRHTLQFNTGVATVDVLAFAALLTACTTHPHTDLQQCDACLTRLKEAADCYGGELLSGFALADAPAFEEWLLLRREHLHQQALAALNHLVQAYLVRGDDAQAHHYASRQLALDPTREESHRQLMRILARRGLRAEALAQYESCRRILRSELAVEPDLETVALVEQIRAGKLDKVTRWQGDKVAEPVEVTLSPLHPVTPSPPHPVTLSPSQEWSEAPETGKVYGREGEQAQVAGWLMKEHCRVVALLGIGGVGKTTLAAATVKTVAPHFARVLWRSLLNAPPLAELLRDVLQRLADERLPDFPTGLDAQLALLLAELRRRRILLVLDNLESILDSDQPGHMRPGYEGYAQLLQTVALRSHQSCLLLTSRERPHGLEQWAEDSPVVCILSLEGLNASAGHSMLSARGLSGPTAEATALVARYSGNPLALKLVAQTVHELFGGDIAAFLAVEAPIFDDIRLVLDQQFARLSPLEQELLLWLAVERAPITAAALRANLVQPPPMPRFLEALRALQRRSLLETVGQGFTLQNVVIEYLTEQLVERISGEIADDKVARWQGDKVTSDAVTDNHLVTLSPPHPVTLSWLNRHALLKAQATESIRQSQARLLLQPVAERLLARMGKAHLAAQIERLLTTLRHAAPLMPGYAGGNLLNLLLALGLDVSGSDFSHLCVWQAYLRGAYLLRLQLAGADLTGAAFTQRVGAVQGLHFDHAGELQVVAFSEGILGLWLSRTGELMQRVTIDPQTFHLALLHSDGRLMAQLTTRQTIAVVDVTSDRLLHTLASDHGPIWRISFSPNGHYLASSHGSGHICIWEVSTGRLCAQWQAHAAPVTALTFAPDNRQIATGAVDGSVALWHATAATLIHNLVGHTHEVPTLGFTPDGEHLITGSHDNTVRLWETASGTLLGVLPGHARSVRQIAIAPNGRWLVTGGGDQFLYLWDLQHQKVHHILTDHAAPTAHLFVSLVFSLDSQTVACYDGNETISVWAVTSGQRLDAYRFHRTALYAVALSPNGRRLVSGGTDWGVYLWDVSLTAPSQVTARLTGHRYRVCALAFSPDGETIASSDFGGGLRLWHSRSGTGRELLGCEGAVRQVAFSPDGQTLASASDNDLHLWSVTSGRQTHLLQGPTRTVTACAFSPDGRWLASAYLDHTIWLWALDAPDGIVLHHILRHHTNFLHGLLFSPNGRDLMSSSYDNTLCRWDVQTGALQASWPAPSTIHIALAFQPDGQRLATGGSDHIIRLLDSETGQVCSEWHGHTHIVEALSFRADGRLLASASQDETIRLWDVPSGVCLQILHTPGPYADMNISGVTGISGAQKAALKALGAVEE